jgi:tRNA-dihydrouridine synthase B
MGLEVLNPEPRTLNPFVVNPLHIGPLLIDPPVLMAPMAGFTNYAYRQIVRRLGGAGLPVTEMVGARSFIHIDRRDDLPDRLWGVADEPRPVAVQIWDNDRNALAKVGRHLAHELKASVVDINFGCPSFDVAEKAQSGSYLLRFPDKVGELVAWVVDACKPVPVTAKIRLGCTRDSINAIDVAQAVEGAGGAAISVHGRTAADMFRGQADWDEIAKIKPHLKRIPVIGNGDIKTPQDAVEAFRRYGVDGVMIGRAALAKPWLFRQVQAALADEPIPPDPTREEQQQIVLDHYKYVLEQYGDEKGAIQMRSLACQYAQGRPGVRAFRDHVSRVHTTAEFYEVVEKYFPQV